MTTEDRLNHLEQQVLLLQAKTLLLEAAQQGHRAVLHILDGSLAELSEEPPMLEAVFGAARKHVLQSTLETLEQLDPGLAARLSAVIERTHPQGDFDY